MTRACGSATGMLANTTTILVVAALVAAAPEVHAQVGPQSACAEHAIVHVDIAAQDLPLAIAEFGRETGCEVVLSPEVARGKRASAVSGAYAPDEALARLLAGTGLVARRTAHGVLVVEARDASRPRSAAPARAAIQGSAATLPAATEKLEEIIVTAQRRSESLQDVPVAISVVSGHTLGALGINNATELAALVPSLQFSASNTSRGLGFAVRGVGTSTFGDGVEQSVGTVVDGVVLGRPGQGVADLADVDQISVLRGPQGILFGKNASAGLIIVNTHLPRIDDLSVGMRIAAGEHGEARYQVVGNVPLGERAAFRLVGYSNERDGLIHDHAQGRDYNGSNEQGARASFLLNVTQDLQFIIRADYSDRDVPCCMWTTRTVTPTGFIGLTQPPEVTAGPGNLGVKLSGNLYSDTISRGLSVQADWNLGGHTLTSITAGRDWLEEDANDADQSVLPVFDLNFGTNDVSQFSQELRLASPAQDRFNWVAGLYWFDLKLTGEYDQGGTMGYPLPPGVILATHYRNDIRTKSFAAFGQANFDVSDRLRLFAGARYTREDYSLDYVRRGGMPPHEVTYIPPTAFTVSDDVDNWSWRLGAQYGLASSANLYFSVARGFKGKALITDASVTADSAVVPPEIPTAYELGLKGTWFEGRLYTNIALFRTEFDDFQAEVFDTTVMPNRYRVTSAGEVVTQGVEVDFLARFAQGLSVGGGISYTDAFIGNAFIIPCYVGQTAAQGCSAGQLDANGNTISGTPEWTASIYGEYEHPLTAGLNGFARANWRWLDDVNFSDSGDPATLQHGYGVFGASVGIASKDDRWRLAFFARNVFDKHYVSVIFPTPFDRGGYAQIPSAEAYRTVGMTLEANF